MFKQFSAAADAESASKSGPGGVPAADASFQDTIRKTMERMQNSGEQATAAAASGGADDFMSELLKQMSSGDFGGGEGSEDDFSKMLMGMMEQLTTKEILYEPMKDLNEKFPEWMEKNKATTPAEDLKRYEEQQSIVKEIVERFEKSTYADTNSEDREYIIERMQKVSLISEVKLGRDANAFSCRCKTLARRLRTWLATCRRPRKPLTRRMSSATRSRSWKPECIVDQSSKSHLYIQIPNMSSLEKGTTVSLWYKRHAKIEAQIKMFRQPKSLCTS